MADSGEAVAHPGTRERIMRGAVRCVERGGVSGFSLEDVANEAGVSRTSIYRYFPEGRAQLVQETATWVIGRFWAGIAESVACYESLEDRLVHGLVVGAGQIRSSTIMANLMDPDLDELVEALQPSEPLVGGLIREYMTALIGVERDSGRLRGGVSVPEAADYLSRMVLSVMASPAGVDLTNESEARALVRREFLAGIIEVDSHDA
ncbi:MAG: TetR/AcrR family transcriptional regulator [Microthrixaceae bacterium]